MGFDSTAEIALFEGQLDGLAVACFENERPLQGLAGLIDWRLHGQVSQAIREGKITGKAGECAYIPARFQGRILHLFFLGGGRTPETGQRTQALSAQTLSLFQQNLKSLRLTRMGVSRADLGGSVENTLQKGLPEGTLWIGP